MELTNNCKDSQPLSANSRKPGWELFDDQAAIFERRAGLPVEYCRDIASAVLKVGEVGAGDLLVEVGPGTGQIGQWFADSVRYVGLDLSAGMLSEFRKRLGLETGHRALIQADANTRWPLADRVARAIFSSRAIHLLDQEHITREVFRMATGAGATFIVGRVQRESDSVRARMAREMNERLRAYGFEGRGGERQTRLLFESLSRRGAEILEPVMVARWRVTTSPRQSLDSWRCLKSLGGAPVPDAARSQILTELEGWAEEVFGGLDKRCEAEETYVLRPIRVPFG
jgi:ubiquinone/menaquinone biosynthesis C-methylase UbiE